MFHTPWRLPYFLTAGLGLKNIHIKESAFFDRARKLFFLFFTTFHCHCMGKPPGHRVMQYKVHAIFFSCFSVKQRENSVVVNFTCSRYERISSQLEHLLVCFFCLSN